MNLIEFLKEVDNFSDNNSNDRLKFALHNIARKVPEEQRLNFLKIIRDEPKKTEDSLYTAELKQKVATVKQELDNLDSDNAYLEEKYNFDYSEWYDDPDEEFYYEDPNGITKTIQKAALVINQLMDIEEYKDCFDLAKTLIQVEVPLMSEYDESNFIDLEEIIDFMSMNFDLSDLILKAAYSCYMIFPEELRAEEVLDIVLRFDPDNFSFQNLFQFGSELNNVDQFLRDCVQELSKAQTKTEQALLEEAVRFLGDSELEIKIAFDNLNNQPELIYNILTKNSSIPIEEKMNLGFKALELMNNNNVRSEIALFLANCILKTGIEESKLNYCYFESFRSVPNPTNLLRLLLNSSEPLENLMLKVKAVIANHKNDDFQDYYLFRNKHSHYTDLLYFLCGEFEYVLNDCVMENEPLGWTSSFMKIAIPMFCFLIYDDSNLPRVFRNQIKMIKDYFGFTNTNYINGLNIKDESDLFLDVLIKWKNLFILKPEFKSIILDKLDQLIVKRVDAIMEKNRRNYYYECAEYVADIGEANCIIDPQFNYRIYLQKFINMYPRRRNFVSDIKTFM